MKLFAVLLLAVYTTQCVLADTAADIKEVDSKYNDTKSDLEKKYEEFKQWSSEKFNEASNYFDEKSGDFKESVGVYKGCSAEASEQMKRAYDEVVAELQAKRDSIAAEMKRERDEAVEKIKEEAGKSGWWGWVASGFNWFKNMMAEGFKYMTGKANEFNEFRKAYSDKLEDIHEKFDECVAAKSQ